MSTAVNFRSLFSDNVIKAQKRFQDLSTRANAVYESSLERRKELADNLSFAVILDRLRSDRDTLADLTQRVIALEERITEVASRQAKTHASSKKKRAVTTKAKTLTSKSKATSTKRKTASAAKKSAPVSKPSVPSKTKNTPVQPGA